MGIGGPAMRGERATTATTVVNLRGRHRENGGQAPEGVVYIGRAMYQGGWRLPASKWANPFTIGRDGTREEVIARYREHVLLSPELLAALPELRGRVLGCWCTPEACHGDLLAELASTPGRRRAEVEALALFGGLGLLFSGLWLIGAQRPDEQRDPVARRRAPS